MRTRGRHNRGPASLPTHACAYLLRAANLAAFMVAANEPSIKFGSVHDLIASRSGVCAIGSYASQPTLEALYPDMRFDLAHGGYGGVGASLIDGQCGAAILPKVDFDTLLTDGTNCQLSVVVRGGSSERSPQPRPLFWLALTCCMRHALCAAAGRVALLLGRGLGDQHRKEHVHPAARRNGSA